MFLAVSPEEKESWVNALNVAIIKAKNRVLDEVPSVCIKPPLKPTAIDRIYDVFSTFH